MRKNNIAKKEVFDFKEQHCNENEVIVEIIRKELLPYFKPPILDVGSGIGDIAYRALKGKKTILLDVNPISKHDYPRRPEHFRRRADFLEYRTREQINTIFISHTLQFIDDDINELNDTIQAFNAENVITVLNKNDDFLGDLIEWTSKNVEISNPEVRITGFPKGYNLIKSVPFKAEVRCDDFSTLAKQVCYLMMIDFEDFEQELLSFLQIRLITPDFVFNQSIDVYRKI